ncbi:DUF3800 domain-containing protein [Clostridium perfringens]
MVNYRNNKKCIMFVDETGTVSISETNSTFGLTGVIFNLKYYNESMFKENFMNFKKDVFGENPPNLHLVDIINGRRDFSNINIETKKDFLRKIPMFLRNVDFDIISVTINKDELINNNILLKDIYDIALSELMDSYYAYIHKNNISTARIVLESREDDCNIVTQNAFFTVYNHGTLLRKSENNIKEKITGFILAPKGDIKYGAGLEIADILCNPLTRVRIGKKEISKRGLDHNNNTIYDSVKDKIFNINNDVFNHGFKCLPSLQTFNSPEYIKSQREVSATSNE